MTRHAPVTYCPRCGDKGHAEPDCPLTKVATSQRGERRLKKSARGASLFPKCACSGSGPPSSDPLRHSLTCPALRVLAPALIEGEGGKLVPWTPQLERAKRERA